MTPCQLAKVLGKNVSSISHHLTALERAGLVEQSMTRVKGNLIEKFYRATAKMFIISYTLSEGLVPGSEDIAKWSREICKQAISSLASFGYNMPPERMSSLLELIEKHVALEKIAFEEVISKQVSPTHVGHPALQLLLDLLAHIYLYKNPEYREIMDKILKELRREERKNCQGVILLD